MEDLVHPALLTDSLRGAPLRESFAELIALMGIPGAEVRAVVWVSGAIAFCAIPELVITIATAVAYAFTTASTSTTMFVIEGYASTLCRLIKVFNRRVR